MNIGQRTDSGQWKIIKRQWTWGYDYQTGTIDNEQYTVEKGQWTMENEQWTLHIRYWTMDNE